DLRSDQPRSGRVVRGDRSTDSLPMTMPAVATLRPTPVLARNKRTSAGAAWRLMSSRSAVAGGLVLLVIVLLALAAPLVSPYDPIKTNQRLSLDQPSLDHLMGTDRFGRDIFS